MDREQAAFERMMGAISLDESEYVKTFFDEELGRLTGEMVACEASDDGGRRDAALLIQAMNSLKSAIVSEARLARSKMKKQERMENA